MFESILNRSVGGNRDKQAQANGESSNQLYMFRAMSPPIIRSTWLYLQLLILSTDIAAGWCHVKSH